MKKNSVDLKSECEDNKIYDVGQIYNHVEYMLADKADDILTNILIDNINVFMELMEEAFPGDDEMTKKDFEKLLIEYR